MGSKNNIDNMKVWVGNAPGTNRRPLQRATVLPSTVYSKRTQYSTQNRDIETTVRVTEQLIHGSHQGDKRSTVQPVRGNVLGACVTPSCAETIAGKITAACQVFFFFRVLHTSLSDLQAQAFARSVIVARSSAVQASSSRRQERRWAIVCGSPQSQFTDWASSR